MKLLIAFLFIINTHALVDICKSDAVFLENLRIQTGRFGDKDCFISLSPRKTYDIEYRNFLFIRAGRFLIFNSFGNGPSDTHTGARELNFFPRSSSLNYKINESNVEVYLVNGDVMTFHREEVYPETLTRAKLTYDFDLNLNNAGGLEIENYESLLLDFGFKMGMSPSWYLDRKSIFTDKNNQKCTIENSQVLYRKNSDIHWKYDTDLTLMKFLDDICPDLSLK